MAITAETNSSLKGNIDLRSVTTVARTPVPVTVSSAGVVYDNQLATGFNKPFSEKAIWLNAADLVRDTYEAVSDDLTFEQVSFPAGDSWTTDTLPEESDGVVSWDLTVGGVWHVGFRSAAGGKELSTVFSQGDYSRGAFVKHSGGYLAVYAGNSDATLAIKNTGVAVSQVTVTWGGYNDHPQWLAANSEWSVRVYDTHWGAVLMNGTEVYRFNLGSETISDVGFGVFASGPAIKPTASYWTERTATVFGGQQQTVVRVFGDSQSAPFYGVWTDAFREALDGSFGIRVLNVENYAVPGENSLNALNAMQDKGLGIANYIVIYTGTNDVQGGSPLSASMANLEAMLDIVDAGGRRAVVVIPSLWLNANQTPNGFATANAEDAAPLRAAFRNIAARRGALVADLQQITGQILSTFVTAPDASDCRVRDRIHHTAFMYRAVGRLIAQVIAGDIVRPVS